MPGNILLITKTAFSCVKILTVKTALKSILNVLKVRNFFFKGNNSRADPFFFCTFFYRNFFYTSLFNRTEISRNRKRLKRN